MYRSDNITGMYRLKIANIDKLYIFDMSYLCFFIWVFSLILPLGGCYIVTLLHCYIVAFSETHEKGVKKWEGVSKLSYS